MSVSSMSTRARAVAALLALALCAAAALALTARAQSAAEPVRAQTASLAAWGRPFSWLTSTTSTSTSTTSTTLAAAPTSSSPVTSRHRTAQTAHARPSGGGTCTKPSTCPQLRQCENGGSYAKGTSPQFYGAYQFADKSTWGMSPEQQDAHADAMYAERGAQPWPVCGRFLR